MIWIARILFFFLFMVALDVLYGLLGLLLSKLPFRRYPMLHLIGLRIMAMSLTFGHKLLPKRCQLHCPTVQCGNWTCPNFHAYSKNPRD